MNTIYTDLLEDVIDWRAERKARELNFYRNAIAQGELSVVPGKERTTRACKCDVCIKPQKPGIRKFFHAGKDGGFWYCYFCDGCWSEIVSADVHVPTLARFSKSVITPSAT